MKVTPDHKLPEVLHIEVDLWKDHRGYFVETWQQQGYAKAGIDLPFVQDNLSYSNAKGILRGLHVQHPNSQGKLVQVLSGRVFDVAVDVRWGSPTFGKAMHTELSSHDHQQLWIPPGFAHGFCVLSENALFAYKCTAPYSAADEFGVRWNDPDIRIPWPPKLVPILSERDNALPFLRDIKPERLPKYRK